MNDRLINTKEPSRLLDAKQLADFLNVPVPWVWTQCRMGRIPYLRVGKYYRFSLEAILARLSEESSCSTDETDETVVPFKKTELSQDKRNLIA